MIFDSNTLNNLKVYNLENGDLILEKSRELRRFDFISKDMFSNIKSSPNILETLFKLHSIMMFTTLCLNT